MVSDRDRHDLYVALLDRLGRGPADTLMGRCRNQLFAANVTTAAAVAGLVVGAPRLA